MKDNNYYTPKLEEFCVGFEGEFYDADDKNWTVFKIKYQSELCNWTSYNDGIRVKYLDQSDIEDTGFKYTGKSIDIWFEKEGNFDMGTWISYKIQMHYGLHDKRMSIFALDINDEYILFRGIINNKSELKKVLIQLGVTKIK